MKKAAIVSMLLLYMGARAMPHVMLGNKQLHSQMYITAAKQHKLGA